jgi:hypothetical protein
VMRAVRPWGCKSGIAMLRAWALVRESFWIGRTRFWDFTTSYDECLIITIGLIREYIHCYAISISLWCPQKNHCIQAASVVTSAADLFRQALLLLSDVIFIGGPIVDFRTLDDIPDIWIDGHGKLLNASYPVWSKWGPITIENRHTGLRACEIEFRGYFFAGKLYTSKFLFAQYRGLRPLYKLWTVLLNRYWPDWARHRP